MLSNSTQDNPKKGLSRAIYDLAEIVLEPDELSRARRLCEDIVEDGAYRDGAVDDLLAMYSEPIKRPVYYLRTEIKALPDRTRMLVFFCASYVELVLKQCWAKKQSWWPAFTQGQMLWRMKQDLPRELHDNLRRHNELFGRKSKHDFAGYDAEEHLYEVLDAVLCIFVTRKLIDDLYSVYSNEPPCPGCGGI